jgi:hypothetical protein
VAFYLSEVYPDTFSDVLFFIDETWQEIEGRSVAALGGVAIPQRGYNAFCREAFALKKNLLGAVELRDAELKGKKCFANRAFRTRREGRQSKLLDAAEGLLDLLGRHRARTFVIWTVDPELLSLRSAHTTDLSKAYKGLLYDFRALMRADGANLLGSLNFDQRDLGGDEAATCAIQNFLVRTRADWQDRFIAVPNFTVSGVSLGLQAADLVAHLGAHFSAPQARPELMPYLARVESLRYEWPFRGGTRHSIRQVQTTRQLQT